MENAEHRSLKTRSGRRSTDNRPARDTDSEEEDGTEEEEAGSHHSAPKWTAPLRKKMAAAGLYDRHREEDPILAGFKRHLTQTLEVRKCQQEVDNVARYLYYMDSTKVSLDFVHDLEKTTEYFHKLRAMGLAHQTVTNYKKSLNRFIQYNRTATDLQESNKALYDALDIFSYKINALFHQTITKGVSQEVILEKKELPSDEIKSPKECCQLLDVAKPDFLEAIQKAETDQWLTDKDKLTVLYYLEALFILRHLQRPGVVQNMKVTEWRQRKPHRYKEGDKVVEVAIIEVEKHRTSPPQVAAFVLKKEEELWFDVYFQKIRPTFLQNNAQDSIYFFISTTGEKIYNPSNDLTRFHQKFNLTPVTSHEIRHVMDTHVSARCTDYDKWIFARYLGHKETTAERLYRFNYLHNPLMRSWMINNLGSEEQPQPSTSRDVREGQRKRTRDENEDEDGDEVPQTPPKKEIFSKFLLKYPLHLDREPPSLKECLQLPRGGRYCYDKWRKTQRKMRMEAIIGNFQARVPEKRQVDQYIERQGWTLNIPRMCDISANWKPLQPRNAKDQEEIEDNPPFKEKS